MKYRIWGLRTVALWAAPGVGRSMRVPNVQPKTRFSKKNTNFRLSYLSSRKQRICVLLTRLGFGDRCARVGSRAVHEGDQDPAENTFLKEKYLFPAGLDFFYRCA